MSLRNNIAKRCTEHVMFESHTLRILELARDTMFRAGFVIITSYNNLITNI